VLYVCIDVETTHPIKALGEVFWISAPGRPKKHNPRATLHNKSQRCNVCYARVAKANRKRPRAERFKQKQLLAGVLGDVNYSNSGCPACNKTICKVCVETWSCPV